MELTNEKLRPLNVMMITWQACLFVVTPAPRTSNTRQITIILYIGWLILFNIFILFCLKKVNALSVVKIIISFQKTPALTFSVKQKHIQSDLFNKTPLSPQNWNLNSTLQWRLLFTRVSSIHNTCNSLAKGAAYLWSTYYTLKPLIQNGQI